MTDILLVRHGQTHSNVDGRWQGWTDTPLNAAGRAQAEAVARRIETREGQVDALYSSPLRRALQTAEIIEVRLGLEPRTLEGLKEIHFGELEDTTLQEMESRFPALHARWQDKADMDFQWPGGERRADFFARVAQACQLIRTRHPDERVVIVAHGGTIRACLAHLLPEELGEWWGYSLANAGLTHVRATDSGARLLILNATAHLPGAEA